MENLIVRTIFDFYILILQSNFTTGLTTNLIDVLPDNNFGSTLVSESLYSDCA